MNEMTCSICKKPIPEAIGFMNYRRAPILIHAQKNPDCVIRYGFDGVFTEKTNMVEVLKTSEGDFIIFLDRVFEEVKDK